MEVSFSFLIIKLAGQKRYGLSDTECKVAEAIRILSDDGKGWCWASRQKIADALNCSKSTVEHAITTLARHGLIDRDAKGSTRTNRLYDLHFPPIERTPQKVAAPQNLAVDPAESCGATPQKVATKEELEEELKEETIDISPKSNLRALGKSPRALAETGADQGFEQFWEVYGHKVSKADARNAWRKMECAEIREQVIEAARLYAANRTDERRFWKHPAGWLRGERWNDDPVKATGNTKPQGSTVLGMAQDGLAGLSLIEYDENGNRVR